MFPEEWIPYKLWKQYLIKQREILNFNLNAWADVADLKSLETTTIKKAVLQSVEYESRNFCHFHWAWLNSLDLKPKPREVNENISMNNSEIWTER